MLGLPDSAGRTPEAPLCILCIGAHPDDIEIGCGGTVLRLTRERPHTLITWAVLSGHGTVREREALDGAASFLGQAASRDVHIAGFRDGYFPVELEAIKDYFEHTLKPVTPDLILTHAREDRHQDHRIVSDLTWNTFRGQAPIAEYEIPKWDGDLGRPNAYVTLDDDTAQEKAKRLAALFPSQQQKAWYDADTFLGLLRLRGVEAATRYAEGFTCRKLIW